MQFRRNFKDNNMSYFKNNLADINLAALLDNVDTVSPNAKFDFFLDIFLNGFNSHFPLTRVASYKNRARKEWMTQGLIKCCQTRSTLYKQSMLCNTVESENLFKKYRKKYYSLITKAKKDYHDNLCDSYSVDSKIPGALLINSLEKAEQPHQWTLSQNFI